MRVFLSLINKLKESMEINNISGELPESESKKWPELAKAAKALQEGLNDSQDDIPRPNPIYIPKHVTHRKKGRR